MDSDRQQRNKSKKLKENVDENSTQYPKAIISDEEALRIHGLIYENDGYSTDSGKSSFDEEYFKYKPQPLKLTRNNTVTIKSVNVAHEERKFQKEKNDSYNDSTKKGISNHGRLSESTFEKQFFNKKNQQPQFENINAVTIPFPPSVSIHTYSKTLKKSRVLTERLKTIQPSNSGTNANNRVLSAINLPTAVTASGSNSSPVMHITPTTPHTQVTSRNKYTPETSSQNSTINTNDDNSSPNRHLKNIRSTNPFATQYVPNRTATNIPKTANNRVLSAINLPTAVTASASNSSPVTHDTGTSTSSYTQITRSRNKYVPEISCQNSTVNRKYYNSSSNRHLKNICSTNRSATQYVPNHTSIPSTPPISAPQNVSSVSGTIQGPREFSDTNNLLEEEETNCCCCQ